MKRIKIFLAVLCVFTVSVAFAGCGNSFDPVAAVEAEMELLTTGTVPEDADDLYSEDLKTVQSEYDKEFQAEVDALVKELDCAAYAEGTGAQRWKNSAESFLQNANMKFHRIILKRTTHTWWM